MSQPSWSDLEALFYETLGQPASERARFLTERCGTRADLRAEIESLVRAHEGLSGSIRMDHGRTATGAALAPGAVIGPYEVIDALGVGGMGAVYRARDTRLNRTVALKALRTDLAARTDLRDRFKREAELIASLNHPHICTLYDVVSQGESDYLVMEFVDGESLASRLAQGPLPVEQAVRLGSEIAAALGRAHARGVVHRDLKPANVVLTRSGGHAKLLDFGVAKLLSPEPAAFYGETRSLTAEGVVVGTPRYMAPEQLEGAAVDHRADLFALGAVLFEMFTGRQAFEGKSTASIIAAVLTHQPEPVSTLRTGIAPAVDRLVKRCLAKDPAQRWQNADDLASELRWIAETDATTAPAGSRARRLRWTAPALALTAIAAVAAFVFVVTRESSSQRPYRLSLLPADDGTFLPGQVPVISPDGTTVAMVATDAAARTRIHLRTLATGEDRVIDGTDQPMSPFWSPDGKSLGFFAGGKLKTVDLAAGAIRTIADAPLGRGASWNRDDQIVFAAFNQDRLYRVSAYGGQVVPVTTIDPTREFGHWWPEFLPDGKHFLYFLSSAQPNISGTYVASLDGGPSTPLLADGSSRAVFVAPDHIVFARDTSIFGQRFDVNRLSVQGEPFFVTAGSSFLGRTQASASTTGVLVAAAARFRLELALYDRAGHKLRDLGEYSGNPHAPALSPDGSQALISMQGDEWLVDISRGVSTRLTSTAGDDGFGFWSADGHDAVFASQRTGRYAIWRKPVEPPGEEELLASSGRNLFPGSMSSDKRWLLVAGPSEDGSFDILVKRLVPDGPLMPLVHTQLEERGGRFSPNGRWFSFATNEAGGSLDVFVASFPRLEHKVRVSTGGGFREQWNQRGDELFYVDPEGRMMVASIKETDDRLAIGSVVPLFQTRLDVINLPFFGRFSVSGDGQQFLMLTPAPRASNAATVMVNWDRK